jgi:hypothetical protein
MTVGLHGRRMVPIFPESAFAVLSRVEFLGRSASAQLQSERYFTASLVLAQQVHVIGGGDVIEYRHPIAPSGLKEPVTPATAITGKFQQKLTLMTAMGDMPDAT